MDCMKTTTLLVLTLGLLGAGCYKREELRTSTPAQNTRIIADLTDGGTVAMGNALGPGVLEVEGVVTKADETEWTLQMLRADHRDGRSIGWNRELVSFPRTALTNPVVVVYDKK